MLTIAPFFRFLTTTAVTLTALFFLLRLGFLITFNNPADPLGFATALEALYIGLKFDLRLALLTLTPVLILGWVSWFSPFSKYGHRLWQAYLTLASSVIISFYMLDFGHYAYLNIRVDSTVLRFADNLMISAEMVWQSYPVIPIFMCGLLAFMLALKGFSLLQLHYAAAPYQPGRRLRQIVLNTLLVVIFFFGIYGKISWYPLRWSDAFFGTHAFAAQVALNPVLYFSDTYLNGGMAYDQNKVDSSYETIASYLGVTSPDKESFNFSRNIKPVGQISTKPNVIVVILESFASYKASLSGNHLNTTPYFDDIANNGYYFPNFFTPHTGTARSVFAFTTGIPDVQLGDTSSRNPMIVDQHMLINAFEEYEKYYFLGGSASWRNIRALLSRNIPGLNIYEEGSYQSPRIDVWGISDLDLFREAHQVLKQEKKPFFAVIQTSGNHRPYTIPEDNAGFSLESPDVDVNEHGFESVEEYNAYRFMDHSIGHFMQEVKQAGYFDNTVFLFFGDHGINHDAGKHSLLQETQLGLGSYRVPFVIYAPELLKQPQRNEKIASEVDVLTTIASLTNHPHINNTFGRDLFNPDYDNERYAFTITHSSNPQIGVIGDGYYFRMRENGAEKQLFKLGTDNPRENYLDQQPELAKRMEAIAYGYYHSARYVMNNNPPRQNSSAQVVNQNK